MDSLIRRLAGHRLAEVRAQAVESVDVLESLDEMLLKSGDRLEGGDVELLVIGTVGSLYVGVVFPSASSGCAGAGLGGGQRFLSAA